MPNGAWPLTYRDAAVPPVDVPFEDVPFEDSWIVQIGDIQPSHANPLGWDGQIVNFERKVTSCSCHSGSVRKCAGLRTCGRFPRGRIRRSGPDPDFAATAQNRTTEVTFLSKLSIWALRHKGLAWLGWDSLILMEINGIP